MNIKKQGFLNFPLGNKKILLGLVVMMLLASSVHALGSPYFIDATNDNFDNGTLHLTNISGSGADANVTLNFTTSTSVGLDAGIKIYNTTGNFTSQTFDTNTTDSRFDKIAWTRVLTNSSDVVGIGMRTDENNMGVLYRDGTHGVDTSQTDLVSDVDFTGNLFSYTIPSDFSYDDVIGVADDDDGSDDTFLFFRNGSISLEDNLNGGYAQNLAFTDGLFAYTIPGEFNVSDIIGFVVDTDNSDSAVFFKNGSFVWDNREQPNFVYEFHRAYSLPSGFNADDAIGVSYDSSSSDIAIFFNNGSIVADTSTLNLNNDIDFADGSNDAIYSATYNAGYNLTKSTNITLQTRVSNDSTTFTPWSNLYYNSDGSENITDNIGRYIQYKAVLTTPDKYITPYLEDVSINFTIDPLPPRINKISYSPNSTDDVDQDALLNFTVNVTDATGITGVNVTVLQYRGSDAVLFTNATARLDADGLYYANFTPNIADTWYYRVYSEDNASNPNNDTSDIFNISVDYERTWKRSPATFDNLACGFSKTCTAGNLTINNTGDFTLNFDLSSNFGDTSFNVTEPFDLTAKEVKVVEVNLTAGTTASESNVVITIDPPSAGADPNSETTNFTFTASAGGPVFELTIVSYPVEVNRSDPGVFHLNSSLKNIGNETAGTTWINWTLPANWLNISGTNLTKNISNVSVQEIVYHNITVNLTSSATTGTKTVNVSAASNNSASDSAAASIVVTETTTVTTVTETTTVTTGGGGGATGGGGGGGLLQVPVKPEEIEISQVVDLVRGRDDSFRIDVTNTYEDSVLENLTMQVEGFLSQYLTINPKVITSLGYQQTITFTVTVAAPAYKGYEEHTLKAIVTGMLVKTTETQNVTVTSKNPFMLKNYISLIIHEVSKEEVDISLEEAAKLIEQMQQAGFSVKKSSKLLEEAKEKLNNRRYKLAKDISNQIKDIKNNAFSANSLILDIKSKIYDAENKGLQVEETRRLLNLAIAAFEREDFLTSIKRAKDAELSIVIETKGKINILKFIIDYWWPILVLLIVISISSYFARKKLTLVVIARRLEDLQKEEVTIDELMQETQKKYYKDKKISTTEYHKAMYGYEKRLSEVSQVISRLRSKRVGIIEISNEIRNLKKEDENVVNLIKQLQDSYYSKQTITRKVYLKRIREYKVRRIEIERSIAVLEAKLAKKEKLEELEAKEVSKKEIISEIKKKEKKFKKQPPAIKPKKKFSFKDLFKRDLFKREGKKDYSEEVHKLIEDLIKREEKPKPVPLKPRESVELKNKLAIKNLFQESKGKIIKKTLIKKIRKKLIIEKPTGKKKEIISKLKDKIRLDITNPKSKIHKKPKSRGYKKHFSEDVNVLRKHGFKIKVPGEKEPEPKYITPKSSSHTKHSILNHFEEVYKND